MQTHPFMIDSQLAVIKKLYQVHGHLFLDLESQHVQIKWSSLSETLVNIIEMSNSTGVSNTNHQKMLRFAISSFCNNTFQGSFQLSVLKASSIGEAAKNSSICNFLNHRAQLAGLRTN